MLVVRILVVRILVVRILVVRILVVRMLQGVHREAHPVQGDGPMEDGTPVHLGREAEVEPPGIAIIKNSGQAGNSIHMPLNKMPAES